MTYTLALGPFHPAWLGPQRFVLKVGGEQVVDVEYQSELNERGCAERLPRLPLHESLHLVARVCGECSVAHALAFCQAVEQLCGFEISPRAAHLRVAIAELERAAAHLRSGAVVLRALGMEARAATLSQLRDELALLMQRLTGARIAPELCVPGGLRRELSGDDCDAVLAALPDLGRALYRFADGLIDHRVLLARTIEVGALPRAAAEQFGVRGLLARGSGIARDARSDHPYAAYAALGFSPITQDGGDVYARLVLLLLEGYESVKLVEQALRQLPPGESRSVAPREIPRGIGVGVAEGPRGALRYTLESDGYRIIRAQIDGPRQLDRLLARTLLVGALLDNAVAIIASANVCLACAER